MRTIDPNRSSLLLIDLQERLVPALFDREGVVFNTRQLVEAAGLIGIPALATEQYPQGLGPTVASLRDDSRPVLEKTEFDASRNPGFAAMLPGERPDVVIAGCEAHVCVLQTALGLLDGKRRVHVVADAIGSRSADDRRAAIDRMQRHGADIVTTEMVLFEWLRSARHPHFRAVSAMVKERGRSKQ